MNVNPSGDDSKVANALIRTLESANEVDTNLEAANVVDSIASLARSARAVAHAILAPAAMGHDAAGGAVDSLTEAVMGVTAGLVQIADAISDLAAAVRERQEGSR